MEKSIYHDYLLGQHQRFIQLKGKEDTFSGQNGVIYGRFAGLLLGSLGCKKIYDFGGGVTEFKHEKDSNGLYNDDDGFSVIKNIYNSFFIEECEINNSETSNDHDVSLMGENSYDACISFDVIEHLHHSDAAAILPKLFQISKKVIILNISCIPARKTLPDGRNLHTCLMSPETWLMMTWQASKLYNKPFALFLTVGKERSQLVHNLPLEYSEFCFQPAAFYPYQYFDNNGWFKFSNLDGLDLEKLTPEERWMKTHVHSYNKFPIGIKANNKVPGLMDVTSKGYWPGQK